MSREVVDPRLDMEVLGLLREALSLEMYIELINMYITETQENFNRLVLAGNNNDVKAAVMAVHSIKGSSGNVGAMTAYEVAKEIEFAGKEGDLATMYAKMPHLQNVIIQTCEAMKGLV